MFPFDFVCKSIAPAATCTPRLFLGSLSPVSYSAVLFGIYFAMREPLSAGKQGVWSQPIAAVSAGALDVIAGAPFDKAKRALFDECRRTLMGANFMFAPFAAMILMTYDRVLTPRIQARS